MSDVLAEVRDLSDLLAALRARVDQLNITRETLDAVAGLTAGHSQKILASPPVKGVGLRTLGPLLGATGTKLLLIEDPDALARVRRRLVPRDCKRVRYKMSDTPRYRALEDHTNLGIGFFNKGAEFEWQAWPKCFNGSVEPANEAAERVMRYWVKNRTDPNCPATPYNSEHARFLLPHVLPWTSTTRMPPLPLKELPGMPRYLLLWPFQFGAKQVDLGSEVTYAAWPDARGMEPINDEAKQVCEYLERFAGHPRILPAPWCDYSQSLFLPDLPERRKTVADVMPLGHGDPWLNELNRRREEEARATLRGGGASSEPRSRGTRRRGVHAAEAQQ